MLRGVAILLVLFRHSVVSPESGGVGIWRPLASELYRFGWTGVDLFFVLSGFLIGGLLFQEIGSTSRLDVRRFLIRRGFKIWPAYFVLIGYVFLKLLFWQHVAAGHAFRLVLPNLLHVQNFFGSPRGYTWSLAVEEHFYLVLPLFLLAILPRGGGPVRALAWVPVVAISIILECTAYRVLHNWSRPFDFAGMFGYTHLRIDGLFFGVLLAYLHHFHRDLLARVARHRAVLLITGFALLSPMFFLSPGHRFTVTFGFTLLYLGYGAILLALIYTPLGIGPLGLLLVSRPMRGLAFVGFFSYSIYLWQEDLARTPVLQHLRHRFLHLPMPLYWPALEAAHILLAVGAGAVMAKLIELPALALRDRLFPSRAQKPAAPISKPAPPLPAPAAQM